MPAFVDKRPRPASAWLLLLGTASVFLLLGFYGRTLILLLAQAMEASMPAASKATLTTRPLPVVLAYGVGYIGVALGLLRQLLSATQTRWAALCYGLALGLAAVLLGGARLTGATALLTPHARAIIDFALSPLPVLLALAFFRLVADREEPAPDQAA